MNFQIIDENLKSDEVQVGKNICQGGAVERGLGRDATRKTWSRGSKNYKQNNKWFSDKMIRKTRRRGSKNDSLTKMIRCWEHMLI